MADLFESVSEKAAKLRSCASGGLGAAGTELGDTAVLDHDRVDALRLARKVARKVATKSASALFRIVYRQPLLLRVPRVPVSR
jgi:hypothetical protein